MPSKKDETIVETPAEETACACGTHAYPRRKMIMHACIGVVALFMLATAFAAGALVGKFAGNHGSERDGRGRMMQQYNQGRGEFGGKGRGMMNGGSGYYGHGMMNGGQGNTIPEEQDSAAPDTTVPAPAAPQGGATQ